MNDYSGNFVDSATIMNLQLNQDEFAGKVLDEQEHPVLVEVWASWCGNCRALEPVIKEVARELAGQAKVYQLKADDNQQLVKELKIMGVPALLYYRHGVLVKKKLGIKSKKKIIETLTEMTGYDRQQASERQYKSWWQRLFGK